MAQEFLKVMQSKLIPIDQQLQSLLATQIAENRKNLHPIVKTIVFCGRQNILLRDHCEDESSQSPGNFKALLSFWVESGHHILKTICIYLAETQCIPQTIFRVKLFQ